MWVWKYSASCFTWFLILYHDLFLLQVITSESGETSEQKRAMRRTLIFKSKHSSSQTRCCSVPIAWTYILSQVHTFSQPRAWILKPRFGHKSVRSKIICDASAKQFSHSFPILQSHCFPFSKWVFWWHEHRSVQKSLLVTFWMWFEASCEETRPAFQTVHPPRCLELDPSAHCFSWGCVDKAPRVCIRLVAWILPSDTRKSWTWEPSERSRRALFPTIHRLGGSDESEVRCPEPLPPAHLLLPLNISEHFWTFSKMLNCIWKSKTKCKIKDKGVLSRFLPPIYSLPPLLLSQLWNFSQNGKKDKSGTRASSSPISYHAMVVPWVAHFTKYLETFELVLSDLTKHSFRCDKSVLWGILRYFLGLWSFSRYSELLLDIS